jgi:nicotinate-nucleotide adenylyltransferase
MKIGIFGGTFNPIHQAHLSIAEEVRRSLRLDKILFVTAGVPPHKKNRTILPAHHRLEMVRLALQDFPYFEVSDLEIRRPGRSYAIDTLRTLKKAHPPGTEWFLILGLDAFLDFPSWRQAGRLLTLCHIVAVSRPGFRFLDLKRLPFLESLDAEPLIQLDKRSKKIFEFQTTPGTRLILLRVKPREVSATAIRNHFWGKKRNRNILPGVVESYIMTHHLLRFEDRN